ncbi:PTS lactose/cellobiose transporter subunit IIA, partial [Enterobacter intestinihominis]
AALTALQMARKGDFDEPQKAMEESRENEKKTHTNHSQHIGLYESTRKLPLNNIKDHSQEQMIQSLIHN